MNYIECAQGSPEWLQARAGCITASMFETAISMVDCLEPKQQVYVDAILAGKTKDEAKRLADYVNAPTSEKIKRAIDGEVVGRPSDGALDYAFRLAIERISGTPLDEGGFETYAMVRGRELEPEARRRHEIETGLLVQRVGFVKTDDGFFGASLDGVIGDDGSAEYKCFLSPEKIRKIWIDNDIGEVKTQSQGGLWVTGRKWMDVGLYCPALEAAGRALWVKRFFRDENYIAKLETGLVRFLAIVNDYEKTLRTPLASAEEASWPFPKTAA